MSETVPWFVAQKRARKADQIARTLHARGVTAAEAVHFDDDERREVEALAGFDAKHKASDTTWRSIVEMLAGSAMEGALCPTCGIGDPEGVAGPRKPYLHPGECSK